MPNKYKHIKLPVELFGAVASHDFIKQGRSKELPGFDDMVAYKDRIKSSAAKLSNYANEVIPQRRIDTDREYVDFKLKVQGLLKDEWITKYNLTIEARYDDKPAGQEYQNDTIIARVPNDKLPNQNKTVFEKLEQDISTYVHSPKDKLKTYFGLIEELTPIVPEVVTSASTMEKLKSTNEKLFLDIVFSSNDTNTANKIVDMAQVLEEDFVSAVDTQLVHVCQVHIDLDQLNLIFAQYGGIVSVEETLQIVFTSSTPAPVSKYTIEDKATNRKPILIADHPIDASHPFLAPAVTEQIGNAFQRGGDPHGTQVGSLAAYGTKLSGTGRLVLDNHIASVNVMKPMGSSGYTFDTAVFTDALESNYDPNNVMVVNVSLAASLFVHERKVPYWFSTLMDEYAVKYNCLFVISAGNLFQANWPPALVRRVANAGYPRHFEDEAAMILPPADAINPLSVGSVAYVSTPNSISRQNEPTFITRRGLMNAPSYKYLKPDLVHYDSNFDQNFISEDNGPFMAFPGGSVARSAGTSFASPLVAHDAGLLIQAYPNYTVNTIKALLIHFANRIDPTFVLPEEPKRLLVGHGIPDIDRALYSLSNASTIVIEDDIQVGMAKRIRIPMPAGIAGSRSNRLSLRKTLVYNPEVNPVDVSAYNPVYVTAKVIREDGKGVDSSYSNDYLAGSHKTSNVKSYKGVEMSTINHMGEFWEVEILAEPASDKTPNDYIQKYSIVLTIEDMLHSEDIDIHQEIQQMIEVEVGVEIEITT